MLTAYSFFVPRSSTLRIVMLEKELIQSLRYKIGIENDETTSPSKTLKSVRGGGNPLSVFFPIPTTSPPSIYNQFHCDGDI